MLGSPEAQFQVGVMFSNGLISERLWNEVYEESGKKFNLSEYDPNALAIVNYEFSSMAGNPKSAMANGYRHLFGYGFPKSCDMAVMYYKAAAEKVVDELTSGKKSFLEKLRLNDEVAIQEKQSQEDVMDYYEYSANKGVTQSQLIVGYANLYGLRGVPQNPDIAREYFERAAAAGEPEAFAPLGNMYAKGIGVPQNNLTAYKYFKMGADRGDGSSMNGLGSLYIQGAGVPKDYKMAAYWFNKSASTGNPEGQYNLGLLYASKLYLNTQSDCELDGLGVPKNYRIAINLFQASAAQGQTMSHFKLGEMHLKGLGVPKSCDVAVQFFKFVAERAPWLEQMETAYRFYQNQDFKDSFLLYLEAAEMGVEVAQSNIAFMYDRGYLDSYYYELYPQLNLSKEEYEKKAVEFGKSRALFWYQRAADQGNVEACVKIGDYYYYGEGTEVSMEKSVLNYRKAVDLRNAQAMFNLGYMHQYGKGLTNLCN